VRVKRRGVEAFVRGQIVIQSDSRRTTDRLLAAFAGQSAGADAAEPLRGVVVPTGFADGRYTALVQVAIPASPFPGVTWQVGMSIVAGTRVADDDSMSLTVQQPGVPLVVEREVEFRPGPYEIVFVAMEDRTGRVHSGRVEGEWQSPSAESVIVGPFAAMQPADAAFVRDGRVSASGALGSGAEQTVRVDRPTAVVGLVCRGSSRTRTLTVERSLVGTTSVPFEPLDVELEDDRCVQVRDVIPAGTMSSGAFSYDVSASNGGRELGTGSFPFFAVDAQPQASATQ
jgi:hypothetical protein